MAVPNFFILGAPKCGSTSLHYYLAQHPDVCMSWPKEPRFLELLGDEALTESYRRAFAARRAEQALGDASPTNLFVPFVPERIARHYPEARFIVILRDPVARAYSDWWMYRGNGMEPLSFPEAVADNLRRLERGRRFDGPHGPAAWRANVQGIARQRRINERTYVDVGYYGEQLTRYLAIFPRDRFHVVLLEDLRQNAPGVIANMLAFLEVDPAVPIDCGTTHNEAHGAVPPAALRMFRLAQTLRLPRILPHGVNNALRRAFSRGGRCPAMDAETGHRLREHYRTDMLTLERLLQRPLPGWLSPSANQPAFTEG